MRCLILIALCFALANARFGKNSFQNLLNRYQNRYDMNDNLFGSDEVDDHIDDYVDEIRRERLFERDQCPRGFEDILGEDDDQWMTGLEDEFSRNDLSGRGLTDVEDEWSRVGRSGRGLYDMDDELSHIGRSGLSGRGFGWDEQDIETRSPMLKEVEDANVKLASRLYEQCKNDKDDKNTVVSPLSVQLGLAALNWGARGNTRRQIARVIGGRLQTQERKRIFTALVRHLKGFRNIDYSTGKHSCKINTVTGLFVSQTTRAQQQFIQQVKSNLGATVKHCSFSHKPQQCRSVINQWVAQKTHNKINRIVPQDGITDNTKMVLVNALELKATWGQQMRRHVTKEAKFYPLDTKKVKIVEVMETEGRFKYYEDELVKIVGVPTKEQELTLYTIVPKDKDGLTEVEKLHLQDSVQLKQLLDKTDKHIRNVQIQLPKFQIKHKVDVRRTLRKQGVTDAFDSHRADFSGITGVNKYQEEMEDEKMNRFTTETEYDTLRQDWSGKRDSKLHLNKFIHQTIIKITENGITATSGSQSEEEYSRSSFGRFGRMDSDNVRSNFGRLGQFDSEDSEMFEGLYGFQGREQGSDKMVKANHAFAFVLKHNPTNQLIMIGRVIDAAQKKVNNVEQTINTVDQY